MTDTAESLISEIRQQYPLGSQPTWGHCSNEDCADPARGSRRCVGCLTWALSEIVGPRVAFEFSAHTEEAARLAIRALEIERGK